jgi:ADP-heptose:LPS heptosyltransferase
MYTITNKKKLAATIAADLAGFVLFGLQRLFRKKGKIRADQIKEVLVIRTAYIGDVVMTLPILKPLKELFPTARISFLTAARAGDVLKNNPFVDEVIAYDPFWFYPTSVASYWEFIKHMRTRTFDLVIEARADIREILLLAWPLKAKYRLSYDVGGGGYLLTHKVPFRGIQHKVEYHLDMVRYLGYSGRELEWGIYLTDDELSNVRELMGRHAIERPFVAVHPGSRLPLKRWPPDRYAAVSDELAGRCNMQVVLLGAGDEKPIVDAVASAMKHKPISLCGELSLREMAGVLSEAALLICNDSAPMHIAASMGTPTVALFGPSRSRETGPYGGSHCVVEKEFRCRAGCDTTSCRHDRYNACLADITALDVLDAAEALIQSAPVGNAS